jgi:hypothetical protein
MNERIKELALEADIHFSSHHQHSGVDTAVVVLSDLEKFAELIVQEYSYDVMNLHGASPERVAMAAKHWGVEL